MLSPLNPVLNSILTYTIIICYLLYVKPSIIYDKKIKQYKQFGATKGKSVLPLPILAIISSILIYITFYYIESSTIISIKYYKIIISK
jgi:hypothetical protein